jgi:hypothetical protein
VPKASINVNCDGDTLTCIDGDQYFSQKRYYPISDVYVYINEFAGYAEDEWEFSRFKLRAGARVSEDDYMNNINIAPRTELQWNIFNDNSTIFTLGYSRYYSANLLANKLREGMASSVRSDRWTYNNKVTPWMPTDNYTQSEYNFRELRTPYTDEYAVAAQQDIYGSILGLKYMERRSKDEFARNREVKEKDGKTHYRLNNNGSSSYRSVQLKWEKAWKNHFVMFNASWSESKTSNDNYETVFGLEELDTDVIYNGRWIKLADLPKDNFNKPYVFNLSYVGKFFNHLTVSGILNYSTPYKTLYSETEEEYLEIVGNSITIYKTIEIDDTFTLDCSFSWEQKIYDNHNIILTLEVSNILDTKNKIGEGSHTYFSDSYNYDKFQMGRQFWAGIAYEF